MQINLPDYPQIASKAVSAGFSTVEDYVRHLIEVDAGPLKQTTANGEELSDAEWQSRFNDLLSILESGNPHFDDSRGETPRE